MPDDTTYSYTYEQNELRNIRIPGAGNISYPSYTLGRPDSMTFPGSSQSYQYDALLRVKDIDSSTLDYSYSYDDVGNILTKSTGDGSHVYDYDDLYRLTDVINPTLDDEAYSYDPVGNRLTASGVSGDIEHNQNNELSLYGDISFDYDANGNMTAKTSASESWVYAYNVQNRLVRVEEDDLLVAEYGYDPFGRRLWKEVDGIRTYFLYSDEGLVAEYDDSGNELRSYGYRPDSTWGTDPLWLKENGEYYWYQNDHLGTPQKLVDSSGTVVWSGTYTAFGEAQISIEQVTNNLRFPGQYFDAETGSHQNYHRDYDPETGRYRQTDPIGFDGGDENLYAYVGNRPLAGFDPYGLWFLVDDLVTGPVDELLVLGFLTYATGAGMQAPPIDITGQVAAVTVDETDDEENACPLDDTDTYKRCNSFPEFVKHANDILEKLIHYERPFADHEVPGGLAGAVKAQVETGELVKGKDHIQKGYEYRRWLKKKIRRLNNARDIPSPCKDPLLALLQAKLDAMNDVLP